jgi:hypothetical protein
MSWFEPAPELLAFIFIKKFIYLELLAVLAALRLILGEGIARYPAAITLVLALAGCFTVFAPLMGWHESAFYAQATRIMAEGGGMAALLVPTTIFAICGVTPRARWRWIDVVHGLMVIGILGLWWWVR